ncbi:gpW family head-tail joining protein [Burkholderia multivorans]|uniref:gpW family head-tail joining protein n=1 Tax=Burkholderia multivorans TaxID=87883 RepID=UPI000D0060D8|nr:gpW family head-tail joining protein [Burkholderia multivorans]MCA8260822.1 gpW family protein [Burkholderia multivorans]MDN7985641.1 gpW family head-tail joining protein [Burkholderia multivorans]PRH15483.1 phage head-tail adapter protein [Burkholderia multivorans]
MDQSALQASLAEAQRIYIQLSTGAQEESLSYTQGDGTRSATYTRANLAQLSAAIQLMQAQLGIVKCPRRAMRITFTRR